MKQHQSVQTGQLQCSRLSLRKYAASFSMWETPGSSISLRAIFSSVRSDTPEPLATSRQRPLAPCNRFITNAYMDSIARENNPVSGFTQPEGGVRFPVAYPRMGRPKTPSRPPLDPDARRFRDRMEELLPLAFPRLDNDTARIKALGERCGIGAETIRAAIKGERSPTLTVLAAIARGFGISLSQLFSHGPIDLSISPPSRRRDEKGPDTTRPD